MCVNCGILHCVWLLLGSTHMGSSQHNKRNDSQTSTVDFIPNTSNFTPPHTFRRLPLNTVTLSDWKSNFQFFSASCIKHTVRYKDTICLEIPNTMVANCEESQYANALFHKLGLNLLSERKVKT